MDRRRKKGYHIYYPSIYPSLSSSVFFYHHPAMPCKNLMPRTHHQQSNALTPLSMPSTPYIQTHTSPSIHVSPPCPLNPNTPSAPHILVHLFQTTLPPHLRLLNRNPHQTPLQHPLPIHPRMHLPKQPRPIPSRRPHQLRLAPRMIRHIRTDIIHFPA
jgi:hypothetical protein